MFVLAVFKDTIKIPPQNLGDDFKTTLVQRIDAQFANYVSFNMYEVVFDVGLCITFHDFIKIGASFIIPGDPATYTPVEFRYVVFRPMRGEVLEGTVSRSNSEGLTISMDFFEDIHIAPDKLPKISRFEEKDQIWYWEYPNEDEESGEKFFKFYIEIDSRVRFRVVDLLFKQLKPGEKSENEKSFQIIGTMADNGLGCLGWWPSDQSEQEGMEEVEE